MLNYILFILGFIFLIKGADFLIKGASAISKNYKVPEITIGLTVVAFGTSLPELVVNIFSSLRGESDLILGNIAGSNIANTLLFLGVGALLATLVFSKNSLKIDISYYLGSVILLLVLVFVYSLFFGELVLSRVLGLVLLLFFFFYLFIIFKRKEEFKEEIPKLKPFMSVVYIILGSAGLFFGGNWVVAGAISLSEIFGFSTMFIGSSIIALGTSLPELVTVIVSVVKKENDLAIGNIVGSNIFNVLLILGVSAIIAPIAFSSLSIINFVFVIISVALLLFILGFKYFKKQKLELKKVHGVIFLIFYALYIVFMYFN